MITMIAYAMLLAAQTYTFWRLKIGAFGRIIEQSLSPSRRTSVEVLINGLITQPMGGVVRACPSLVASII